MSYRPAAFETLRSDVPVAVEFAAVVAALTAFSAWAWIVGTTSAALLTVVPAGGSFLLSGLVTGGITVVGVSLFVAAYASLRDVDVRVELSFPSLEDLPWVGLATVAPAALVGVTKLVGDATGVPFNSLTMSSYGAGTSAAAFLAPTALWLLVGVPALVAVCQVLVQGSAERVVEGPRAVAFTTLFAGFLAVSDTGGLTAFPTWTKLAAAALFVLALGVARYVAGRTGRRRLRSLAYLPAVALVLVAGLSGVAEIESIAGAAYAATLVLALGVAAYTYDRTDSLLVPALAYLSLLLTSASVVYVFEAGMKNW